MADNSQSALLDIANTGAVLNQALSQITKLFENLSQGAPFYACRAWVNFDGTKDDSGAVSTANTNRLIRGSGNVASVLRTATGNYTLTLATALPDANYALVGFASNNDNSPNENWVVSRLLSSVYSATSCEITVTENYSNVTLTQDCPLVNVLFFR